MQMLEGNKYFYMVLNGLMIQDPDDFLLLEDHAMNGDIKCVTNIVTKRTVQLKPCVFMLYVDHFNVKEGRSLTINVAHTACVEPMVESIMNYLSGQSDQV